MKLARVARMGFLGKCQPPQHVSFLRAFHSGVAGRSRLPKGENAKRDRETAADYNFSSKQYAHFTNP